MPVKKAARKTARPATEKKSTPVTKAKMKTKLPGGGIDFSLVYSAFKDVMAAYAGELHVAHNEPKKYDLVTKSASWRGGPMFFGAVIWGKAYVSYHLMPLYLFPSLKKTISAGLKRRMQGKACFNFHHHDDVLAAELSELTAAALEQYRVKKLL